MSHVVVNRSSDLSEEEPQLFYTNNILSDYRAMREEFRSSESLVSYMIDQAQLADYLEEGMTILKAHSIDLDKMDITTAGA